MARIVLEVKDATKALLDKNVAKSGKSMKEYILWSTGLSATEAGKVK